jgi:two-component system sensor histidine kinase MprB
VAIALAAIAFVATAAVGIASYRLTQARLMEEIDRSLSEVEGRWLRDQRGRELIDLDRLPTRGPFDGFEAQVLGPAGAVRESSFPEPPPLSEAASNVLGQPGATVIETIESDGVDYRLRTIGQSRGAVQVGRGLDETDRVLRSLRARTLLLGLIVAGVAMAAGWWIAGRVTASLRRLTAAAEHVEATGELDTPVGADGNFVVGRLGAAFDRMLAAVARSRDDQQRLVEDAGHELRTPLTSLRTNVDTLRRHPELAPTDRAAIVADLHAETEELTELVNEIVAVASGDLTDGPRQQLDLAELASDVAARYQRRTGRAIVVAAVPTHVVGQRSAIQRAISCLLDNARKFDPGDGPIEVSVSADGIAVADRGTGIPDQELGRVFDRFHRADEARALPGSGLGLSIVRDVARRHGGDAYAQNRPGGGAVVGFTITTT